MIAAATIVQTKDLIETVIYATVSGIGVTAIFSMAILGVARFTDLSQEERRPEAGLAAAAAGIALVAVLGAVVFGVIVMTSK